MTTALVWGATGQDGSYLSELLLEKGYHVIGVARRASTDNTVNISHLLTLDEFTFVEGDITDFGCISHLIFKYQPDEIYNLAAQSHVGTSFHQPGLTWDVTAKGVLNILEAIRIYQRYGPDEGVDKDWTTRFYQASSSEMFGDQVTITEWEAMKDRLSMFKENGDRPETHYRYQDENTKFNPQSPYSIAKLAAHNLVGLYRKSYGLHASCGILFNHESERRGKKFVTRKITNYVATQLIPWVREHSYMELGSTNLIFNKNADVSTAPKLSLGNLDAERDWGHAEDYVKAMWMMLQQDEPDDYVISTCQAYSVKELLKCAFEYAGIADYEPYVTQNPEHMRPSEVPFLKGDYSKAKKKLGWEPTINFKDLVTRMIETDLETT